MSQTATKETIHRHLQHDPLYIRAVAACDPVFMQQILKSRGLRDDIGRAAEQIFFAQFGEKS